ncbi:MAG: tetratricopeptide repeat protein [Rhodospirillales bacterium]
MHHDRQLRPLTTIRPRQLPAIAVSALFGLSSIVLIALRRDLLVFLGEPGWMALAALSSGAMALSIVKLVFSEPLIRITPDGVELPHILAEPLRWAEIKNIQATTRRSRIGDIHDRLLFHLKRAQIVAWKSSRFQRLFGDTPQAAIAVDIGFNWPARADDVKRIVHDAARTYAKGPSLRTDTPPARSHRKLISYAFVIAGLAVPGIAHLSDLGLARQFSAGLDYYRNGEIDQAIPLLESDARAGDTDAAFALGSLYLNGDGVTRNTAMAAGWFRRAAESGHGEAANNIGNAYRLGLGTPEDIASALTWYQYAADHGSAMAAYTLGNIYRLGDGIRRDYPLAITWLQKAASRNFAPAEHDLGQLYQQGIAVPRDMDKALDWYQRAASRGHAPARYDLARLMLDGNIAQRGIGLTYLMQAAETGYAPAQRRLSAAYMNTQDLSPDPVIAYKWIALAERSWPASTRADLVREKARITAQLNSEQLDEAKKLIRSWRPVKD